MSVDVMWRVALLGAVFAIDLMVFIDLVREEWREWRTDRIASGAGGNGALASASRSH